MPINVCHSAPIFQAFEDFCRNNNTAWPTPKPQLQKFFKTFEEDTRKENNQDKPLADGVKVSTIHAAKGLGACVNPAFSQTEKENLPTFREGMPALQKKLSVLATDGIGEYMKAYGYYV